MWEVLVQLLESERLRNGAVIVGVMIAVQSILTSRQLARRKQAADLLFASRGDSRLQSGAAIIFDHHQATDKNIRALSDQRQQDSDEAKGLRYVLNHFELVSVGIQHKIYDEHMIKESWCSIVCTTYKQVAPYIDARREATGKATIYQEFEWLAKRWKDKPLAEKPAKRWYQFWRL